MKTTGCLLIAFLLLSVPAFASDFTLFGGVQEPGKITLQSATSGATATATQIFNDPFKVGVFGFRYGQGKTFGAEHTLSYASNFLDSQSRALIYNSNLMLQIPTPVLKPFVTAGAGGIFVKGSGLTDIGKKFAFNYGGGLKLLPPGPVGARIDVRGYTVPSVQGQTLNILEVSLGVVFHN